MLKRVVFAILALIIVLVAAKQIWTTQRKQAVESVPDSTQVISEEPNKPMVAQPKMTINSAKTYTATMHTDKGDIVVELNAKQTPITVNNFVTLAKKKFYDGTIFHRTIKGFMIQGGDPTGTGRGGPGYTFEDEPFEGSYEKGTLAMANAGPDTNGSQFFIMHAAQNLPPDYTIFGKVIEGLDVVDAIATAPVQASATGEPSQPVTPVKIKSVDVVEK